MTVNPRLQIRLQDDAPLAAWLDSRSERMHAGGRDKTASRSRQAMTELGLWKSALLLELRRIRLTLPQARAIAAVCNSWMLDAAVASGPGLVFAECYDAFRIAREKDHLGVSSYAAQYGIDEAALLDYLGGLGPAADAALRDAITRWWEDDGRDDSVEGFGRVGLRVTDVETAEDRRTVLVGDTYETPEDAAQYAADEAEALKVLGADDEAEMRAVEQEHEARDGQ